MTEKNSDIQQDRVKQYLAEQEMQKNIENTKNHSKEISKTLINQRDSLVKKILSSFGKFVKMFFSNKKSHNRHNNHAFFRIYSSFWEVNHTIQSNYR